MPKSSAQGNLNRFGLGIKFTDLLLDLHIDTFDHFARLRRAMRNECYLPYSYKS